ncbi:2835_t:CDS:2 [Cetraspora pellucida]|uniref:ATP-dependent DNA helicase n=1 Tax=Cetraspora pellucida TaxID=1433469 RepID=A0A9N9NGD5_9GLOM|nr:2835_t:CDS:2 [Cetraspora pellucida]
MVGQKMLALIDMQLRQAFPEKKDQPFGGRSIILIGDFGQLPPVLDDPMFLQTLRRSPLSNNEDQRHFRDILLRLRDGETTMDDWKTLTTRFADSPDVDNCLFLDATSLLPRKVDVDEVNFNKLRSLNCPVAKVRAIHDLGGCEASRADSNMAKGLEACLLLARGARIMLRANLWTEVGLVNGSMGTIQEILFEEGKCPPFLPSAVLVEFDNYNSPSITTVENKRLVPILPIRQTWESKSIVCSRLQFPINLAWAITVHKSQGLTLPKAIVDLGEREYATGLSFVAISRVRSLKNILFHPFLFERLQRIRNSTRLQNRKSEEERLVSLIT